MPYANDENPDDGSRSGSGPDSLSEARTAAPDVAEETLQQELEITDLEFIRVLEDLITVLIDKRVVNMTDFPEAARSKIVNRYYLRSRLADISGMIVEQEDFPLP